MEDLLSFFGPEIAWPWLVLWSDLGIEKVTLYSTELSRNVIELHYADKCALDYAQVSKVRGGYFVLYVHKKDVSELQTVRFNRPDSALRFLTGH